jgi:hypothetical protein
VLIPLCSAPLFVLAKKNNLPFTTTKRLFTTRGGPLNNIPGDRLLFESILESYLKPQIMSYKVKSLVYLICFIAAVVIYAQVENTPDIPQNENTQLVQNNSEVLP